MAVRVIHFLLLLAMFAGANAEPGPALEGLLKYKMPNFPVGLRGAIAGDGEVVVALTVDASGKVDDCVALLATHDDFARAALSAVRTWEFSPIETQTQPRREILEFSFRRSGVVTSLSHAEAAKDAFVSKAYHQITTVQHEQLDDELKQISGAMPKLTAAVLDDLGKQPIVVNFVVDTQGRVRVPVVMNPVKPMLAQSLLEAVAAWRYLPPVHDNKTVLVEVTRAFVLESGGAQ